MQKLDTLRSYRLEQLKTVKQRTRRFIVIIENMAVFLGSADQKAVLMRLNAMRAASSSSELPSPVANADEAASVDC